MCTRDLLKNWGFNEEIIANFTSKLSWFMTKCESNIYYIALLLLNNCNVALLFYALINILLAKIYV